MAKTVQTVGPTTTYDVAVDKPAGGALNGAGIQLVRLVGGAEGSVDYMPDDILRGMYVQERPGTPQNGTLRTVGIAVLSIVTANPLRQGLMIWNLNETVGRYVYLSTATPSETDWSFRLLPGGYLYLPRGLGGHLAWWAIANSASAQINVVPVVGS